MSAAGMSGVDEQVLASLEASVGGDVLAALVAEFLSSIDGRLDAIDQAVGGRDAKVLIKQTHDLGSESGSLGLMDLHRAARQVETAAKLGEFDKAFAEARRLRALATPPLAELRRRYPEN